MTMPTNTASESVYERVVQHIFFSHNISPGAKIVETKLAHHLGVSRIPVRESLRRLAGQGLLVGDKNGDGGVRLRSYTAEEIHGLYELRELLEGGAARAAARAATEIDLARMEMICERMSLLVGKYGSVEWADLDHFFHHALADASQNDRIALPLKCLLTECHYLFYLFPVHRGRFKLPPEDVHAHMQCIVDDHCNLLDLIRRRDAEAAERKAREDIRVGKARFALVSIAQDLAC